MQGSDRTRLRIKRQGKKNRTRTPLDGATQRVVNAQKTPLACSNKHPAW